MPRDFRYKTKLGIKLGNISKRVDAYIHRFDKASFESDDDAKKKIDEFTTINKMVEKMEMVLDKVVEGRR